MYEQELHHRTYAPTTHPSHGISLGTQHHPMGRKHSQSSALKSLMTRALVYVLMAKNVEDSTKPTPVIQ
jgi:hypothetical protein